MNDQEKSALLLKAMEVTPLGHDHLEHPFVDLKLSQQVTVTTVYDCLFDEWQDKVDLYTAPMQDAWWVLNWGGGPGFDELMCMWFYDEELTLIPYADAQRAWLDRILSLIIETEK